MKKLFKIIPIALFAFVGFNLTSTDSAEARMSSSGKACPDIMKDPCCERGQGNCLDTVVIIAVR